MDDHSNDSSDSDDLPSYNLLILRPTQPDHGVREQTAVSAVCSTDSETAAPPPPAVHPDPCAEESGKQREVVMISSESEGEEAYVPLALRLKQRFTESSLSGAPVTQVLGASLCQPAVSVPRPRASPAWQCNGPLRPSPEKSEQVSNVPHSTTGFPAPEALVEPNPLGSLVPRDLLEPNPFAPEGGSAPGRRGAKRTVKEIKASREEALNRKAEREKQQAERDRQQAEKKALADAVKALRPEECIKHMVVSVDPALLQLEGGGTLLTSLQASGCSCAIEQQAIPHSVTWARRTPGMQFGDAQCTQESHMVVHVPVEDFITMVHNYSQEQRGAMSSSGQNLTEWTRCLLAQSGGRMPSLAIIDIEKYFRWQRSQGKKKYRQAVLGTHLAPPAGKGRKRKDECGQLPELSRIAMEEALVDLQLHTGVQVHFLVSWKDFCDYVTMSTKAAAEAPFKREREQTGFSFCLESEWAGGQRVDREGRGLLQVWRRQIQQLNRVSADMAAAVLAAYPSPQLLAQAYGRCLSERDKQALLSDVLIRRGEGVTSTTRRVGPELSKRLYLLMTSADPSQALDSTG